MPTNHNAVEVTLPNRLTEEVRHAPTLHSMQDKMAWVIALAKTNLEQQTGGPFAAALFNQANHCVSAGVNLVTLLNNPILHAETTALMFAHKRLGCHTLDRNKEEQRLQLVTSTEPCVMCLGACCWSGISSLVCAARDEDAREIGFDEGPKPDGWIEQLQARGIEVHTDILREQAIDVLQQYRQLHGIMYGIGN